jgi:hypothetical protein
MKTATTILFAIAAAFLVLLAVTLVGYSAYQVGNAVANAGQVLAAGDFGYIIIDSVGYVVIAIAILDIAKHLIEEEVLRDGKTAKAGTFGRNLSEFLLIISIAVFLEGLVLVFKVTQDDIKLLIYPVSLLLVGVAMTIGLAVFQWLGAKADKLPRDED